MAHGFKHGGVGSGASLNFKVIGGTSAPASPKENTIWVETDTEITDWAFSANDPFSTKLNIQASHTENGNSTSVTITDENSTVLASQTIAGTEYYSVFTDQTVSFETADGSSGVLTCSVQQTTTPFFNGTVAIDGVTVGTVSLGTGGNSSYAWSGEQAVNITSSSVKEGTVWISTANSSTVSFNVLKKNCIQVYPISAKQYVSGVWVDKTAKSYQGGKWVDWIIYLIKGSELNTEYAGTWNQTHNGGSGGSATMTSDGLLITANKGTSNGGSVFRYGPDNKIDFTGINSLDFVVTPVSGSPKLTVVVTSSQSASAYEGVATLDEYITQEKQSVSLPVSNVSGEYYLRVGTATGITSAAFSYTINSLALK